MILPPLWSSYTLIEADFFAHQIVKMFSNLYIRPLILNILKPLRYAPVVSGVFFSPLCIGFYPFAPVIGRGLFVTEDVPKGRPAKLREAVLSEYGPKYAEWVLLQWGNLKFANPKLHSFQGISGIDLHVFELG